MITTSSKFDKKFRDFKDAVSEFYDAHRKFVNIAVCTAAIGAFGGICAGIGHGTGYRVGYYNGVLDTLKIGIEQHWFRSVSETS